MFCIEPQGSERKAFMGEYYMVMVWAALFVLAIVVESQTAEMVAIWFLPSTLVSLILAICKVPVWIQCAVFLVLSTVLLILAFKYFRKLILKDHGKKRTDTDRLLGEPARVEEEINNLEMKGSVKINGQIRTARMKDDRDIVKPGEFVIVESISGVKLICVKKTW